MSVHRGNQHQMEALTRLAAEHKAATVKFNPVTFAGRGIAMYEGGETLDFKEHIALSHWMNSDFRPRALIPVIFSMPQALTPLKELWRQKGESPDCGIITVLGILGTGEIALCGIGQTIPQLVFGHLGTDSIRDIWLSHPVILGLRRDLENTSGYPGICGPVSTQNPAGPAVLRTTMSTAGSSSLPNGSVPKLTKKEHFRKLGCGIRDLNIKTQGQSEPTSCQNEYNSYI